MKKFLILLLISFGVGCSNSGKYQINDDKYKAKNYDSRVRSIVVHYTALNDEKSLRVLTEQRVSAHYVITTKDKDPIFSLVPDNARAWHAGVSEFDKRTNLNDTSIGIEIVNLGYDTARKFESRNKNGSLNFRSRDYYYPYTEEQIQKVAYLIKTLQLKHSIPDSNVLGHSDISPGRKQDPGPYFPWKRLYFEHGIGHWYNNADKIHFMQQQQFSQIRPSTIKKYLSDYGYKINETDEWDDESRKVIHAFQQRFRPENTDGNVDLETYAIIRALRTKYHGK